MKKLVAMILCLTMIISTMTYMAASANETEPAEYIIRHVNTQYKKSTPTFETLGDVVEGNSYIYADGKHYTALSLSNRTSRRHMQFNFLKGDLKYQNVSANQEWVKPAYYDIYFYPPGFNANYDSNATVTVFHNGETTKFTLNQTTCETGAWNLVSDAGTPLYFSGNGEEYINISSSKYAEKLGIGSIRIVENTSYTGETKPIESKPLITDVNGDNGKITLVTNGSSVTKSTTVCASVATYINGTLTDVRVTSITIAPKSKDATVSLNVATAPNAQYKVFIMNNGSIETYNF